MNKFTTFLKSIIYEVTEYNQSLDSSIKKIPEEFEKFYFLNFRALLYDKGTESSNKAAKGIDDFKKYCSTQSLDMLVNFLNWAKTGIEKSKKENIIVPLGGNVLEKIDNILNTGLYDDETKKIVYRSIDRYEQRKNKDISNASNEMIKKNKQYEEEYNTGKINYKEFQKKSKLAKEIFDHAESNAKKDYWHQLRMEVNNLTKSMGSEGPESTDVYKLRIATIETIIKDHQDQILNNMLRQQSEILNKKENISYEKIDEIPVDSSLPSKINSARQNWNTVIKLFSELGKSVVDKQNKRQLLKTVPKQYLIFAPLFFNDILSEFSLDNDITVNQYNDILTKSFLKDLSPEFKYYLDEIEKNKSRERRLIIQKISSVLKKVPSEFKNAPVIIQPSISRSSAPIITIATVQEVSKEDIEKPIDILNSITYDDIEISFRKDLFGSFQNKMLGILKLLPKITFMNNLDNKNKYKKMIENCIDDFEIKMLTVEDKLSTYLKNKRIKQEPFTNDDKKLSETLNGFEGIVSRIGLENVKTQLKEIN